MFLDKNISAIYRQYIGNIKVEILDCTIRDGKIEQLTNRIGREG